MNVALWIAQGVLALVFLMAGGAKLAKKKEDIVEKQAWAEDFSDGLVKFVGAAEVIGALGLVLPAVTGIATVLVPLAATGIAVVMVGAAIVHARRSEPQMIVGNLIFLALAVFVAWGRFGDQAF